MATEEEQNELDERLALEEQLVARLRAWFKREAPRILDEHFDARFAVTINFPQGDDDGTLFLDARIEETNVHEELSGRVPGVKFR